MKNALVRYVKIAALGVVAIAMAACARTQGMDPMAWGEPLVGEPPKSGDMIYSKMSSEEAEAAHVERLSAQLDQMTSEIAMVRAALAAMGALPEQNDYFIPVDMRDMDQPLESPFKLADVYADGAPLLRSEIRMAKLASNIRFDVAPSGLLNASDLSGDPEIDALCIELSALSGACTQLPIVRGYR